MIFLTDSMIIESVDADVNTDAVTRASINAALADPGRLAIVDRLSHGDASPSELQGLLSMPSNLIAHHLNILQRANVIRRVRSEGDEAVMRFTARFDRAELRPEQLRIDPRELEASLGVLEPDVLRGLRASIANVRAVAEAQLAA